MVGSVVLRRPHILAVNQICWVLWTEPAPIPSRSGPANPSKKGCNWAGPTGPGISAFEGSAFVFG